MFILRSDVEYFFNLIYVAPKVLTFEYFFNLIYVTVQHLKDKNLKAQDLMRSDESNVSPNICK